MRRLLLLLLLPLPPLSCECAAPTTTPPCEGPTCAARDVALVIDPAARSCELVLQSAQDAIVDVSFSGVRGAWLARGDATGVAFAAERDAPIADDSVVAVALGALTLGSAVCFDAVGAQLAGTPVAVVEASDAR